MLAASREKLTAVGRAMKKVPYFNAPAVAFTAVGKQLMQHGGSEEIFGQSILGGVLRGLKAEAESGEVFPICPLCGKRHQPVSIIELLSLLTGGKREKLGKK